MFTLRKLLIAAVMVAAIGSNSSAQVRATSVASTNSAVEMKTPTGPRISEMATGIRRTFGESAAARAQQPVSMGKPMALMIVGGAAFILGAVIHDPAGDLFMIGGAVSFLIGLFQYIR